MKLNNRLFLTILILLATGLVSIYVYEFFNTDHFVNGTYQGNIVTSNQVSTSNHISIRDVENITSNSNITNSTISFNDGTGSTPASWIIAVGFLSVVVVAGGLIVAGIWAGYAITTPGTESFDMNTINTANSARAAATNS